jgi:sugar transferase EpsL
MKRAIDIVVSGSGLVILFPLLVLVSVVVTLKLGKPIIFSQLRPGKNSVLFRLFKFRTMTDETDDGVLLSDQLRLNSTGRILRSLSLDELPTLYNVLKGDMSLVGPRPLLPAYLDRYTPEQSRRHDVRPGITGWAQVNGRNLLDWESKFKLDVWYVDNYSMMLDIKILLLTALKVFRREGISQAGEATMSEFQGTADSN